MIKIVKLTTGIYEDGGFYRCRILEDQRITDGILSFRFKKDAIKFYNDASYEIKYNGFYNYNR